VKGFKACPITDSMRAVGTTKPANRSVSA